MKIEIIETEYGFAGRFQAMASPCECLVESFNRKLATQIIERVSAEAFRIEQKFSRYRKDNLCSQINQSNGKAVSIDDETYELLSFADNCYQLSEGLFDLTSGILRRVWRFTPNSAAPAQDAINALLPYIGWTKVEFNRSQITLPQEMEVDFGGIGKEYAVDRAAQIANEISPKTSILVNFGGDLRVTNKPKRKPHWQIGVDSHLANLSKTVAISVGAVCTSGDTERYIIDQGKRYSHILNPKTGWPIENAPKTITVISDHCLQAGILATLAMLQGKNAEQFLTKNQVKYYCQR